MNNIMELNELIYAGAKLVCDKIGVHLRTRTEIQNLNGKSNWKHRFEIYDKLKY